MRKVVYPRNEMLEPWRKAAVPKAQTNPIMDNRRKCRRKIEKNKDGQEVNIGKYITPPPINKVHTMDAGSGIEINNVGEEAPATNKAALYAISIILGVDMKHANLGASQYFIICVFKGEWSIVKLSPYNLDGVFRKFPFREEEQEGFVKRSAGFIAGG